MIIRPTVWVPGLGPNSGFDFRAVILQTGAQLSWSSGTARKRFPLVLGRATRAHYRSKVDILQDRFERFSKTFSLCFFYCKF